ncbi:MAG: type IX secretion system membrane protein PorP/SprF [Saprospiraceae bacterium]
MNKIIFLLLLSGWFVSANIQAQQEHQYTQFMYNKLVFNPAFAGAREVASVSAIYRNQWMGFDGAPTSYLVGYDQPFLKNKLGFGLNVHRSAIGVNDNYAANMCYSYSLIRTDDVNLKMGIGGTFRYNQFSFSELKYVRDPNDPAVATLADQSKISGNVGAGLYYTYKDFYVGFSIPNLYRNKIQIGNTSINSDNQAHYYAMAGGIFALSDNIDFKPSIMMKFVNNAPFSGDINASFLFSRKVTAGVSYRFGQSTMADSFDGLLFLQVAPKLGFGLAYDYNVSQLSSYNKGTIEALIRYDFQNPQKNKGDLTNPRFFF